jgi:hypothetical protein
MTKKEEKKEGEGLAISDDRPGELSLATEMKDIIYHEKSGKTTLSTFATVRLNNGTKIGTMNAMFHLDDGQMGILASTLKEKKITMDMPILIQVRVPQGEEEKLWRSIVAKNKDEAQTTLESAGEG